MVTKGYGFTVKDIDNACPAELEPYAKAYELEKKQNDTMAWLYCGNYILSAVSVAVEHCIYGKRAKSKYIDKPMLEMAEEQKYAKNNDRPEYKGMSDEEKENAELNRAINYLNSLKARF